MLTIRFVSLAAVFALMAVVNSPSFAAEVGVSGSFTGASNHETSGNVSVAMDGDNRVVVLGDDFRLDGAPDPKVGFGTDGKYDLGAQLGVLESNSGEQRYVIPADLDISKYNEIYIWCEAYSVPLGVAKVK